jgi:hypothetical protein
MDGYRRSCGEIRPGKNRFDPVDRVQRIDRIVLSLTDTLDDSIYDQPLTLWSDVPSDWESVVLKQGSGPSVQVTPVIVGTRKVVYFSAVPDRGFITMENPAGGLELLISSLSPSSADAGTAAFTLTVAGTGFVSGSVVRWNGSNRTTTYVSSTQIRASIPAADLAAPGAYPVTVLNPDGGVSNAASFTVKTVPPVVHDVSPSVAVVGSPAFTLSVSGSNFVSGAKVRWSGSDRATSFVSSTQLTASIPASDIAVAGTYPVTVLNPDGGAGGGFVRGVGSLPVIGSLSPTLTRRRGLHAVGIGSNFVSGAKVRWSGRGRLSCRRRSWRVDPASDIAAAGTYTP